MPTSFRSALCLLLFAGTTSLLAQSTPNRLDLSVTYVAGDSLKANASQKFWMQGGSLELGANVAKGWGIAANVTGLHANSIGSSGVSISLVTATFGPRYRWNAEKKLSIYGEGLIGEANGFASLFPSQSGQQPSANSLAAQVGGGIDYRLSNRFAIRAVDAAWLRTQLPNATNNIQTTLRLGTGLVIRLGK